MGVEKTDIEKQNDMLADNAAHRLLVKSILQSIINSLRYRAITHDIGKDRNPELSGFLKTADRFKKIEYGSSEYYELMNELDSTIAHHYRHNRHHPQHFKDGVDGMTLTDIIEMFCDWKAASVRHGDATMEISLLVNKDRFRMSEQLFRIFENTRKYYGW